MNIKEKFEQLYEKKLKKEIENLENARNKAYKEGKNGLIICVSLIILLIAVYFTSYSFSKDENTAGWIVLITFFVIIFCVYQKTKKPKIQASVKYINEFKTTIIKALLEEHIDNVQYFPNRGVGFKVYKEAEFENYLLNNANYELESDDLINGTYKTQAFTMAEIWGPGILGFSGLFVKMKSPKKFNGKFFLRNEDRELIPELAKLKVELDSQKFENYFNIYCTNKVVAMQLLTADIMKLLVDFREETGIEYEITIKNSFVYIRFRCGRRLFEPKGALPVEDYKEKLYRYYRIIDFSTTLMEMLINLITDTEYN